jgi:hypothetical protein
MVEPAFGFPGKHLGAQQLLATDQAMTPFFTQLLSRHFQAAEQLQ